MFFIQLEYNGIWNYWSDGAITQFIPCTVVFRSPDFLANSLLGAINTIITAIQCKRVKIVMFSYNNRVTLSNLNYFFLKDIYHSSTHIEHKH